MHIKTGIGQDSHSFDPENKQKKLILAGVVFDGEWPLKGNSDADVILHALTNAISGITGTNILGAKADQMCLKEGITGSREYVKESLKYLNDFKIAHVSISLECRKPKVSSRIEEMKRCMADLLQISEKDIGLTATSGEDLTAFGEGRGIQAICIVTAVAE